MKRRMDWLARNLLLQGGLSVAAALLLFLEGVSAFAVACLFATFLLLLALWRAGSAVALISRIALVLVTLLVFALTAFIALIWEQRILCSFGRADVECTSVPFTPIPYDNPRRPWILPER